MNSSRFALMVLFGYGAACGDDGRASFRNGGDAGGGEGARSGSAATAGQQNSGGTRTAGAGGSASGRAGAGGNATGGKAGSAGRTNAGAGSSSGGPMLPTDASGFTELTPSADTVQIHVSNSTGSDANDGRSPEKAVKTVARGVRLLRDNKPDWLLFKRGDTWQTGLGGWALSGRSATERMVIGAYGEGERPRFEFEGEALSVYGGVSEKENIDNLVFTSLHFLGAEHDPSKGTPTGPSPTCISWLRGGHDVLFEDMRFEYCQVNVTFVDGFPTERFRFHRCLFLDSFAISESHAQAILLHGVKQMSLEENVFDRCGWHPDFPAANPTIFNHCIYWQTGGPGDGLVRGNVIMRAASHGAQMRSSGRVEGNVFARNAIGGFLAAEFEPVPVGTQGTLIGNLFTEGEDTTPRQGHEGELHRGWGWDIIPDPPMRNAIIRDNLFTHCLAKGCRTLVRSYPQNTTENNLVWNWGSGGSEFLPASAGPFKDPDRTLASYNASLGGEASFDAFAAEVRKQSKTNWRTAYSAASIVAYFRQGFTAP